MKGERANMIHHIIRQVPKRVITTQVLPAAFVAALVGALPWAVKRRMRPPLRETPHRPGPLGLPGREVWLAGPRDKNLHGWWQMTRFSPPCPFE